MLQSLRSLVRRVLNRIERALHPGRRRRALARLRAHPPERVVFVCLGNICRSPFAELWMHRAVPDRTDRYTSAGFMAGGRSSPDGAVAAARAFGLDLVPHVSRSIGDVESDAPRGRSLWVVMEGVHRRDLLRRGVPADDILMLGDLDPGPVDRRAILDPYGRPPEYFAAIYGRLERCLRVLADEVERA